MIKKSTKDVREYECDNEQDEEFIGHIKIDLTDEERLLEAIVKQVVDDCRKEPYVIRRGKKKHNPLVTNAFTWLMFHDDDDEHVPFTFAWICNELGWQPENFRAPMRRLFVKTYGQPIV